MVGWLLDSFRLLKGYDIMDCRNQLPLDFSPATRTTDPDTSRVAEKVITESGKRLTHCEIIYECLKKHNGSTTRELAVYLKGVLTPDQIWKRPNELAKNDLIERNDKIVRDGCVSWWLI